MLLAFRKWTKKQDEFAKFHKLQIPLEMNAQKLMKSLEKELKMDIVCLHLLRNPNPTMGFVSTLPTPGSLDPHVVYLCINVMTSDIS